MEKGRARFGYKKGRLRAGVGTGRARTWDIWCVLGSTFAGFHFFVVVRTLYY